MSAEPAALQSAAGKNESVEQPIVFRCRSSELIGVLHRSLSAASMAAGYSLHGELAAAIEGVGLPDWRPAPQTKIHWIDVVGDPERPLSPASEKAIGRLSDRAALDGGGFSHYGDRR